jgi:hypothetical protein
MERAAVARGLSRANDATEADTSTPTPLPPTPSASTSSSAAPAPQRAPPTSPDLPPSNALPPPPNSSPLIRSPPHGAASTPVRPSLSRAPSSFQGNSSGSGPNPADLSTAELMAICQGFIDQLRSGSAPWLLQRLNNTYGPMPSDPSVCGYWMASVSNAELAESNARVRTDSIGFLSLQVIPIDEYEKAKLLPIRSPRLRLALIVHWVEQLRSSWWFSRYGSASLPLTGAGRIL